MEEKLYTIPLSKAKSAPKTSRAPRAIKVIKEYLHRYLNAEEDSIHIDSSINEVIWAQGNKHIPPRIRVRIVQAEEGIIEASLPGVKTRSEVEKELEKKKEKEEGEKKEKKKEKEEGEKKEKKKEKEEGSISEESSLSDEDIKVEQKSPDKTLNKDVSQEKNLE